MFVCSVCREYPLQIGNIFEKLCKGWVTVGYAISFKYLQGSLLEYSRKKVWITEFNDTNLTGIVSRFFTII